MAGAKRLTKAPFFHEAGPFHRALDPRRRECVVRLNGMIERGELPHEEVPCLCGSEGFAVIGGVDRYGVRQRTVVCDLCGLVRSTPRMTAESCRWFYGSDAYRELYETDLDGITAEGILVRARHARPRFGLVEEAGRLEGIGRVLEVGCGGGWNLHPFHARGIEVVGYDLGERLVRIGRDLGMDLRTGSAEEAARSGRYDLVILSHVIEHLAHPVFFLSTLRACLSAKGCIYVEVPDMDLFSLNQLQSAHNWYFTARTLFHYLARAGLEPIAFRPRVVGSHMGGLFRFSDEAVANPLEGEPARIRRIIRRVERRMIVSSLLRQTGLGPWVRRIRDRVIGDGPLPPET